MSTSPRAITLVSPTTAANNHRLQTKAALKLNCWPKVYINIFYIFQDLSLTQKPGTPIINKMILDHDTNISSLIAHFQTIATKHEEAKDEIELLSRKFNENANTNFQKILVVESNKEQKTSGFTKKSQQIPTEAA